MAWLTGWDYRKSITLSRASGAVANYQMRLLVGESSGAVGADVHCDEHSYVGFTDLRFTSADGETLLDHWIESVTGTSPNQIATVWIEFDSIGTGATTFYMYYGPTPNRHVYYNGRGTTGYQKIGTASGDVAYGFTKYGSNPILSEGPSAYDSHGVAQPCVIKIGNTFVMYYSGQSSADVTSICIATSTDGLTWTKYGSNPVLQGTALEWDASGVNIPIVYDTGVVGTKRFRMLYTGYDGSTYQIGYAYSSDGLSWTKGGANPVVANGSGGFWDETHAVTGSNIFKIGSTYYHYYGGYNATRAQSGLVTFTDFEGTYTKFGSSPIIASRTSSIQTLTAQTNAGTTTVTVADTSVFTANEPVFLCDGFGDGSNNEFNRIASIDSSTQITLTTNTVRDYPQTTSTIRSWLYGSNTISYVKQFDDSTWGAWVSAFRALTIDFATIQRETTAYYTSSNLISWTLDYANSPPLAYDPQTVAWDQHSAENISLFDYPTTITNVSSGANTFILFDDFERGSNGDGIGGSWTVVTGACQISTDHAYGGTRSGKLVGGAVQPSMTTPLTNSAEQEIRFRVWKENAADFHLNHGNGTKVAYPFVDASENINYFDTASRDTGANLTADAWDSLELNNFNFAGGTFDIYHADALAKSGAVMWTNGSFTNLLRLATGSGAGNDTYLDNVLVRNWRATGPAWGTWSDEDTPPSSSASPSISPSSSPSESPSVSQSRSPSESPSGSPSLSPSASLSPSSSPSLSPSISPSSSPSISPSMSASLSPSSSPSRSPSSSPSSSPSESPSASPSGSPSMSPSESFSRSPSASPSRSPSMSRSASPSRSPSASPSLSPSELDVTDFEYGHWPREMLSNNLTSRDSSDWYLY